MTAVELAREGRRVRLTPNAISAARLLRDVQHDLGEQPAPETTLIADSQPGDIVTVSEAYSRHPAAG